VNKDVMMIIDELKSGLDKLAGALSGESGGMPGEPSIEEPELEVKIQSEAPPKMGGGGIKKIRPGMRAGL
jgi:hypothetical protein